MDNNKYKVLLVEDEGNIRTIVTALLETAGYQVIGAERGSEGWMLYGSHNPDLVILDLGLPDGDGSRLLKQIRQQDVTPVIVLSARGEEGEKVRLLDMGANDYVTKPFGSGELLARVRTALRSRRQQENPALPGVFQLGELTIRYESRRVFLGKQEIHLTQTEYNILAFLSAHQGKVMTYYAIIQAVWREGVSEGSVKRLQVNMANIRKKLGMKPGQPSYIVNELGVGYRMQDEL